VVDALQSNVKHFEISVAAIDQTIAKLPFASTGALQILGERYAARHASGIP